MPDGVEALALGDQVPRRRLLRVEREDTIDRPALTLVRHVVDRQAHTILEARITNRGQQQHDHLDMESVLQCPCSRAERALLPGPRRGPIVLRSVIRDMLR